MTTTCGRSPPLSGRPPAASAVRQTSTSAFLRGLGCALLMMQCGMPVVAESFRAAACRGLFTHYRREEDPGMTRGKLDEELARVSLIADAGQGGSMVLFNESFASTDESEGSQIAAQVVGAMLDANIRVAFVTHLHDLAQGLLAEREHRAVFLRAERLPDGRRTFRVVPGEPLATSYGQDLYARIFGTEAAGD